MPDEPILTYIEGVAITSSIHAAVGAVIEQLKARGKDATFTLAEAIELLLDAAPQLSRADAEALMRNFLRYTLGRVAEGTATVERTANGGSLFKTTTRH